MNIARIVVLAIALGAGGVAAYLASGADSNKPAPPAPVAQLPTVDVLVAKSDIMTNVRASTIITSSSVNPLAGLCREETRGRLRVDEFMAVCPIT